MNALITLTQSCVLGAAFLVALFYFGFGVTRFLLPPNLEDWRVLSTPFVGLALVVVWDYLALYWGINLTLATYLMLGPTTIANGAAILLYRRNSSSLPSERGSTSPQAPSMVERERGRVQWLLVAVALVAFLASIAPLVRYGYVTIIGENWDYEFYLPLADALRSIATGALVQAPANPLMNIVLSRHILPLPMGFSYLQSSLDVLFRLDAIDSFAVLLGLIRALGVVSAFVFSRATLNMRPGAALAASGLLSMNGLLLWATYWNYGLHLTSLTLLPMALTFGAQTLLGWRGMSGEGVENGRDGGVENGRYGDRPLLDGGIDTGRHVDRLGWGRHVDRLGLGRHVDRPLLLAALFLAALNVTFHPTLVVALLLLAGIGLYALAAKRDRLRTLAFGTALVVLTVFLSFPTLFHVRDFLREYYGREPLATGLREFVPLTDAYGFSQYSLELVVGHTIPTPALYDLAKRLWDIAAPFFLVLALIASIWAIWKLVRDKERRAVWYVFVGASIIYVAVFRLQFLHPYPYGFLKSLTLVSFVLIALAVQGISDLKLDAPVSMPSNVSFVRYFVEKRLFYVLLLPIGLLTTFTFAMTLEQYFKPAPPFFSADDLSLRSISKTLPQGAQVFVTDRKEVQRIPMGLASYALREYPLYGQVSTGYGDLNNAAIGAVYDFALLARGEDPTGRGYQTTPLWANNKFALYAKAPGVLYHRAENARINSPGTLTFTLGANQVVTGTQTVSSTIATRGVSVALATFVPQTVALSVEGTNQSVTLTPGLSIFQIPEAHLPGQLEITSQISQEAIDAASNRNPGDLPNADGGLFVPWIELRVAGGEGEHPINSTNSVLVRCSGENALDLNARCFVANPGGAVMRWEYVLRGTPGGTREDQELIRVAALGSPRATVDISAGILSGVVSLRFDDQAPNGFSSPKLTDGTYRAALEVLSNDILVGQVDLYSFNVTKNGTELTRKSPPDQPLLVVKP